MSIFCRALGHKIPKHALVVSNLGGIEEGSLPLPAYISTRGPLTEDGEAFDKDTKTTTEAFLLGCERCGHPLARVGITVEPVRTEA